MAITNPPRAGDLVDITDQADCLLTVSTTPVDLSTSHYNLDRFDVSYDRKVLTFTEVCTAGLGSPSFTLDNEVELQFDFGSGLDTYFTGRIRQRRVQSRNNDESYIYVAHGTQMLANEIVVKDGNGLPLLFFGSGTTIITTLDSITVYSRLISDAITDCNPNVPDATEYGIL
jgi:hypothetical protein